MLAELNLYFTKVTWELSRFFKIGQHSRAKQIFYIKNINQVVLRYTRIEFSFPIYIKTMKYGTFLFKFFSVCLECLFLNFLNYWAVIVCAI